MASAEMGKIQTSIFLQLPKLQQQWSRQHGQPIPQLTGPTLVQRWAEKYIRQKIETMSVLLAKARKSSLNFSSGTRC